jgi:hypothetical protein
MELRYMPKINISNGARAENMVVRPAYSICTVMESDDVLPEYLQVNPVEVLNNSYPCVNAFYLENVINFPFLLTHLINPLTPSDL